MQKQKCLGFLFFYLTGKVPAKMLCRLYENKNIVFLLDIYVIRRYNSKQQKPIK